VPQISLVDHLSLDGEPHLVALECTDCGARFFGRRNACASCSSTEFRSANVSNDGVVRTFSIVTAGPPGIASPYVAAIVDCDGTSVRGNLVNVEPDPEHVRVGMKVRLTTFVAGTDGSGVDAIAYGYEPQEGS
jgi:uncharacterized OB-fold protein